MQLFLQGLVQALNPTTFLYILIGIIWGIIGGAIPGISASVAMSLLLPFTYGMDAMYSLPMLAAVYVGAEYGGSIPAILIKTPGTGAAAATVLDGYEMNAKGLGGKALCMSLYAGVLGGMVSVMILVFTVIPLSKFALRFGPTEYFWMAIMGLSVVGAVSGKNPAKGFISAIFGLFLAVIGMDSFTAVHRFTFGVQRLSEGLEMIPVMVGLFAVSEVLRQVFNGDVFDVIKQKFKMTYPTKKEFAQCTPIILVSGAMGSVVGALPGAGATIASWIAYSETKMLCKNTETFGTGDIRGVAAPESANNSVPAGGLIPLLALGIPGSNSTAILMAGFTIAGISCGPMLFVNEPEIPYRLMACMFVAQIILAAVGLLVLKPLIRLTSVSKVYLTGAILVFAFVGAYAVLNDIFASWMVLVFGLVGFLMKRYGFAPPAAVLGFVLGELVENNMRRALQLSHGSYGVFFSSAIDWVLIALTIVGICFPFITAAISKKKAEREAAKETN